ncbi:hypothetical protein ACRAWF_16075 [Streptomyces sp. L7]
MTGCTGELSAASRPGRIALAGRPTPRTSSTSSSKLLMARRGLLDLLLAMLRPAQQAIMERAWTRHRRGRAR